MEGQGSQAQAKPPLPPPAERDSHPEGALGLERAKHSASQRYEQCKPEAAAPVTRGFPAMDGDPTKEEAERGGAGVSGLSLFVWPPPNAHPVGSELRIRTLGQTSGLEEPSPGTALPAGTSAGEEELPRREVVCPTQRGSRRVQPVFTFWGDPQEGSSSRYCVSEVRRPRGLGSSAPSRINFLPLAAWLRHGGKECKH